MAHESPSSSPALAANDVVVRHRKARDRRAEWESIWRFSCWNENDPNRAKIEGATESDREFASCVRIARRAVMAALEDPTQGATHYHAKGATPPWTTGRTPSAAIGNHLFYNDVE